MKHALALSLLLTLVACTPPAPVVVPAEAPQSQVGDAATDDPELQRALEALRMIYAVNHIAMGRFRGYGSEGVDPRELSKRILAQAERGSLDAQYKLGHIYSRGDGLPQDYALARAWFEKAAELGSTEAMHSLASMQSAGEGVPPDDARAAQWIRKAAELGDAEEQMHLCLIYALGEGVQQDFVLAYAWCNIGSSGTSNNDGIDDQEPRELVAKFLSPAQLAEGQSLSSGWKVGEPLLRPMETTSPPDE